MDGRWAGRWVSQTAAVRLFILPFGILLFSRTQSRNGTERSHVRSRRMAIGTNRRYLSIRATNPSGGGRISALSALSLISLSNPRGRFDHGGVRRHPNQRHGQHGGRPSIGQRDGTGGRGTRGVVRPLGVANCGILLFSRTQPRRSRNRKPLRLGRGFENGAGEETRTLDVHPACAGSRLGRDQGTSVRIRSELENRKPPRLRRGFKMERAKRLELSTSTLARWCSTN